MFGNMFCIVVGLFIVFWCGSFVNSYMLVKMKIVIEGKWLWIWFIGFMVVGEVVDFLLFYVIVFYGIWFY